MKNKSLLIFAVMVCVLFVACTKKPDKLLTLESGIWFCDITQVTIFNVTNEPTSIVNSYNKFEFFKNSTGKSRSGYNMVDFTWEIRRNELYISSLGIIPFTLKSKSKDKMVWERTYNSNGDYETYIQTIELMRL